MRLWTLLLAALFVGCEPADKDSADTDLPDDPVDLDGDGYSEDEGDCDDGDAASYPGADEVWYDGVDQNCDQLDDYDQDGDGTPLETDCDDANPDISPDAAEVCDGIDNDCNDAVDEAGELEAYADVDADGFGTGEALGLFCDLPAGTASNPDDCDDTNAAVSPVAEELCDGVDNDCDARVDADALDGTLVYDDTDLDGFGNAATGRLACELVDGTVEDATDCDDTDVQTYPGAPELCDLEDNNCDGTVDEGSPEERSYYQDADADGYGDAAVSVAACGAPAGYVELGTDCDDADATRSPGAAEVCDGIDNNCDAGVDVDPTDGLTLYADTDGDGYGDDATIGTACEGGGFVEVGGDCDDAVSAVNPGAAEVCDTLDNDCNGSADESSATDAATWYLDADADGYGDTGASTASCTQPTGFAGSADDCDDADATSYPDAPELCDERDNDCNGTIDDGAGADTWFADTDGDGYGDAAAAEESCEQPAGYVADARDCDDGDAATNPAADETCDGEDDDCDGTSDEDAVDGSPSYADADADGYGDPDSVTSACELEPGRTIDASDCDDGSAAINPAATEACDGDDNNCDGAVDEAGATGESTWYIDADGDGSGAEAPTADACDVPSGYAATSDDCDDADATVSPTAAEADDGLDNDCDGLVDEDFVTPGDIIITEVHRQPRFGAASVNTNGQWFELHNTTAADIDISDWYIERVSSTLGADGFYVDPADFVIVPPGGYVTFCKTDNFVSSSSAFSTMAPCDYYWGNETAAYSYSATYEDNTFNLQRDEDFLAVYRDAPGGTLVDEVRWYYDATGGYWPRDATQSLSLDPAAYDSTANDDLANWCSTPASTTYAWYNASASAREYGTPASTNYTCP